MHSYQKLVSKGLQSFGKLVLFTNSAIDFDSKLFSSNESLHEFKHWKCNYLFY